MPAALGAFLPFKTLRMDIINTWLLVGVLVCSGLSVVGGGGGGEGGGGGRGGGGGGGRASVAGRNHSQIPRNQAGRVKIYKWGPWGATSACTRTCGVGVKYRKRYCYKTSEAVTMVTTPSLCGLHDRDYSLCNTQPCGAEVDDFRSRQCSAYDHRPYRGGYHKWAPYKQGANRMRGYSPCALICTSQDDRHTITAKFANTVIDGTPCYRADIPGVCIQAKCVMIGCDNTMHSRESYDVCGVCGGNGSDCHSRNGTVRKDMKIGYSSLLTLPKGARKIRITEVSGTSAVFAIRNEHGFYFVNAQHSVSNPTVYREVGGTTFLYHHPLYEEDGLERIVADGPINETLFVMMLSPSPSASVVVNYSYIVRKEATVAFAVSQATTQSVRFVPNLRVPEVENDLNYISNRAEAFNWEPGHNKVIQKKPGRIFTIKPSPPSWKSWVPSTTKESRRTTSVSDSTDDSTSESQGTTEEEETTSDSTSDVGTIEDETITSEGTPSEEPPSSEKPSSPPPSPSETTSEEEEETTPRTDHPQQQTTRATDEPPNTTTAPPTVSSTTELPQTTTSQQRQSIVFYWRADKATECSSTCTTGVKQKFVRCFRGDDHSQVSDEYCDAVTKPQLEKVKCADRACDSRWVASAWSKCSVSCGIGQQERNVRCYRMLAPGFDSTVHDFLCGDEEKPISSRRCTEVKCGPQWEYSQWGECSTECGHGTQRRDVRCSTRPAECNPIDKPQSMRHCNPGACVNKWSVSVWSKCSGPCGTGLVQRSVTCRDRDGELLHDRFCDQNRRPLSKQACGDKPDCPPVWVAQQWAVCSVACGDGITTRKVVCGGIKSGEFTILSDSLCSHLYKPPSRSRCRENPCKARWYVSEWTECSETCGTGGSRIRKSSCYRNNRRSPTCDLRERPPSTERCLLRPCSASATTDDCQDTPGQDCEMVVRVSLCKHHYYRHHCCQSCERYYKSSAVDKDSFGEAGGGEEEETRSDERH